ncbi:radical SAM protein [Candidatus Nitrosopumilus sediminis]|uniref:Radical SAM family protein n=1 Tax=Candidatus Nitrosopumilus sediminis TaxID=1229909 RepID=K0BFI6_9ARCH|nr:radical SAM protein [Candidatus Nitrosopumilus sediminis]AFS83785.1 radical SAM family protein [Candidatus Nitrosopumilus sediminis]
MTSLFNIKSIKNENNLKKQTASNWPTSESSHMELQNFDFTKKILFHPEKITEYKQGKRPFPITLEIDLTNKCNHRCSFCNYAEHIETSRDSLKTDILKERLKEAKKLETKGIVYSGGGEPMVHRDYFEIIRFTKELGFDVGTITNGSIIAENNVDIIIKNLQWIRISVAGGDRNSYRNVQGVDQFDKIIENIKTLSKRKDELDSNINIGIRTLVTPENISSIPNLTHIIKKFNIDYIQLAPDQYTTDKGKFWNSIQTQQMLEDSKKILESTKTKLLGTTFMKQQEKLDYPRTCYAHFFKGVILAEGDYGFCQNIKDSKNENTSKYLIGNIYKQTLKEIWESDKNKEIEKWVKPNNCGLFCKHMAINNTLEDIVNPSSSMSPNFIG